MCVCFVLQTWPVRILGPREAGCHGGTLATVSASIFVVGCSTQIARLGRNSRGRFCERFYACVGEPYGVAEAPLEKLHIMLRASSSRLGFADMASSKVGATRH